jgi:DNA-binding response OmpR family regulator
VGDAKKRILVVEDEDNLRELVQSRLENEGYEVATAADGFQAIGKARQTQPDLVILDLMIPKMDGYSVCRLFKSGGMAHTPIIIFSARSSPEDVRRGLDMGASAYVSKPFDAPVLLDKIRELLFPAPKPKEQPDVKAP